MRAQGTWKTTRQLTFFLEHLNLRVFYCRIFGVANGVLVSTVIILVTKTARVNHIFRYTQKHEGKFCLIWTILNLKHPSYDALQRILTFFKLIHHFNFEGTPSALFILLHLSCFPSHALDTLPSLFACAQLSLREHTHKVRQECRNIKTSFNEGPKGFFAEKYLAYHCENWYFTHR